MQIISTFTTPTLDACRAATVLQESGNYQQALMELSGLWDGPGSEPALESLNDWERGELLLLAGTLTGQLGSSAQVQNIQETAKDFLTRSAEVFQELEAMQKLAEAKCGLAVAYWRSGAFAEAGAILKGALSLRDLSDASRLRVLITLALVEEQTGNVDRALALYSDCVGLCGSVENHYLLGSYHMNFAIALKNAGETDRALIESVAADFHLEQCGHLGYQAAVLNNTAMLLMRTHRLEEAEQTATRAERIYRQLRNLSNTASVLDTKAQIFFAQAKYQEAERCASQAVRILSQGDERAVLVNAITTYAVTLLRLGRIRRALEEFGKAIEIAHQYLSETTAANILRVMIEELVGPTYLSTQVGLETAVDTLEGRIIKESLQLSNGRVTEAAFRLQMSHQALAFILDGRQKSLLSFRAPKRRKAKSLMKAVDLPRSGRKKT